MSYITENTVWPSAVELSPQIKDLVQHFYELGDIPDPQVGNRYATEIFATDGVLKGPFGPSDVWVGEAEIRKSKLNAWTMIISRRHQVKRVFIADALGYDLMLIGEVQLGLKNGKSVTNEFSARMLVDEKSVEEGNLRLALSSVWSDTSAVFNALK